MRYKINTIALRKLYSTVFTKPKHNDSAMIRLTHINVNEII